jgi:uncharacterized membrane protein (GlpM family)
MTRPQILAVAGIACLLETLLYALVYYWITQEQPDEVGLRVICVALWVAIVPYCVWLTVITVKWAMKPND